MVVINTKLHLSRPCKNPIPAAPWVIAETSEKTTEKMPSSDKTRNNVTSMLKVSKTHFKLRMLEITEAEFRANIVQWKFRGNIVQEVWGLGGLPPKWLLLGRAEKSESNMRANCCYLRGRQPKCHKPIITKNNLESGFSHLIWTDFIFSKK